MNNETMILDACYVWSRVFSVAMGLDPGDCCIAKGQPEL